MELKEINKILSQFKDLEGNVVIPMNYEMSESEYLALKTLCKGGFGYCLSGYVNEYGVSCYRAYKPDSKDVHGLFKPSSTFDAKGYYQQLESKYSCHIIDNYNSSIPSLNINKYENDIDNCQEGLDNVLVQNYKDWVSENAEYLMVCIFVKSKYTNIDGLAFYGVS